MKAMIFTDRAEAGRMLAAKLSLYAGGPQAIVLGLPRGGLPVANAVACELHLPLDVYLARKLGVPGNEEFAFGAIAEGGVQYLNHNVIASLDIPGFLVHRIVSEQREEIARRQLLYRDGRKAPDIHNKTIILVDDGIATGSTVRAAVQALRQHGAARIILAIPVAPREISREMERLVDEFVCLEQPEEFTGVGEWYRNFEQVSDEEVREILRSNAHAGFTNETAKRGEST